MRNPPSDAKSWLENQWHEIIKPTTVNIILGKKGTGKSALAYWLTEELSQKHQLTPIIINLPRERQSLLPDHYLVHELGDMPGLSDAIILIDEGTTMLPAGKAKLEDMVKGYVALSRQRNQIILFVFHSPADVGSRILRNVDALLLKEPSWRQIRYGAKDEYLRELLTEAKGEFKDLAANGKNTKTFSFIDCEEPEFRGMLENPLPSFWSDELSKAWAGVDNLLPDLSATQQDRDPPPQLSLEEVDFWQLRPLLPNYPQEQIMAIEGKWSKKELQDMAEKNTLRRSGDKDILVRKLLYIGVLDNELRPKQPLTSLDMSPIIKCEF